MSKEKTIADYGKTIARLVPELDEAIAGYLSQSTGDFGTPLERRKQLAVAIAFVVGNLVSLKLENMAQHRRWLAARPQSGLIVK